MAIVNLILWCTMLSPAGPFNTYFVITNVAIHFTARQNTSVWSLYSLKALLSNFMVGFSDEPEDLYG